MIARRVRPYPVVYLLRLLCYGLVAMGSVHAAQAQIARVAVVQQVAEKRSGGANPWLHVAPGSPLEVNDRLRTGRRSKVDVKFTDGSLLRLGQLSSVEFRTAKGVTLTRGQLLFSNLRPGQVLAGTAAAEITGSSGIISMNDDGTVDFSLYSGAMSVSTAIGTVALQPGQLVTARTDGTLSAVRAANPFFFSDNTPESELVTPPGNGPSVGSPTATRERENPFHAPTTHVTTQVLTENRLRDHPLIPFIPAAPVPLPNPFPTPFPTVPPGLLKRVANPAMLRRHDVAGREVAGSASSNAIADAANNLDLSAALQHMAAMDPSAGQGGTGDVRLIGVYGNGGSYGYGGRLYAGGSSGRWFVETEFTPLRVRTADGRTRDLSTFTGADITYRLDRAFIRAGRQKFLAGPTQATLLGSMVRQAGRDTMDAMSVNWLMGKGRLDVAYIYDAFPNNLPFRVPGAQHGWYGRYSLQKPFGNFGVNLLNYQKAPISSGTGVTADFAIPLISKQLELYGEAGRDPFKRGLTAVGFTLPGLYNRTGFDVYVEYAKLRGSSVAADLPPELAVLVYRRLNESMNMLLSLDRFSGTSTRLSVGLSTGTRLTNDATTQ